MSRHLWCVLAVVLVSFVAMADEYPSLDEYSLPSTREVWAAQLTSDSLSEPIIVFHPFGHLHGLAGDFEIRNSSPAAAAEWLLAHADMLGIPGGSFLELDAEKPFYEFFGEESQAEATGFEYVFRVRYGDFANAANHHSRHCSTRPSHLARGVEFVRPSHARHRDDPHLQRDLGLECR